jgi:hypothetical protein
MPSLWELNSHHTSSHKPHSTNKKPRLKTEGNVGGKIQSFFGRALKVEVGEGVEAYVKISELKEKYLFSHLPAEAAKAAREDKIIQDLFLSTINPLKGSTVTKATLENFQKKVIKSNLKYSANAPKPLYDTLRKIRAELSTRKGLTKDRGQFIKNIQLGDIIFHRTDDNVHSGIVQLQKFSNALGFGAKHRDAPHHNHVYMCAKIDRHGKKWFAEAAWPSGKRDEIRLISENDLERCFLKQDHGAISEVFRCKDKKMAARAAREARQVTTKLTPQAPGSTESQPTALRYSIGDGAGALFKSNAFGHMAKVRLFRRLQSDDKKMPTDFVKPTSFFCSSLVGYAYQMAEARPIVKRLEKGEPSAEQTTIGKLIGHHRAALRHGKELDKQMKYKIDTKHTTPADLYSWLNEHKNLFTSIQSYQQPNRS